MFIDSGVINASDISIGTIKTSNEMRIDNGLQLVECKRTPIQTVDVTDIFELCCGGVLNGGRCYG